RQVLELEIAERRDPAVGEAADQPQHARLVPADPDLYRVRRRRSRLVAGDAIVPAVEADGRSPAPGLPDDGDRLLERLDRLARRPPRAAHGLDRVPNPAG